MCFFGVKRENVQKDYQLRTNYEAHEKRTQGFFLKVGSRQIKTNKPVDTKWRPDPETYKNATNSHVARERERERERAKE